jgi:hypothetical protein
MDPKRQSAERMAFHLLHESFCVLCGYCRLFPWPPPQSAMIFPRPATARVESRPYPQAE